MAIRIVITAKIPDARALARQRQLQRSGFSRGIAGIEIVDVFTVDADLDDARLESVAAALSDPVSQRAQVGSIPPPDRFDWAIEVGFLPGVTDNTGHTAREITDDLFKIALPPEQGVYSSQITFLSGDLSRGQVEAISRRLANPLIHSVRIWSRDQFISSGGMSVMVPRVRLETKPRADVVEILEADDEELAIIGKLGIADRDGTRRGPLALDLTCMRAIRDYFLARGREPTDVEVESLAQTWSEHCKHTIFADPLDEIGEGLFKTYIAGATDEIRRRKGDADFCVSVFRDNSGAILFDQDHLITHKVETHNSPSALDPFGGAITGIVGVNRDAIGFGLGAKPVANVYGFCLADPGEDRALYRGPDFTQRMLSPRAIMEGVIAGVNQGGNCSGIPTPQGFLFFHHSYRGKPLVFVGTVGLILRESVGRPAHEKKARPGDYIVMAGGRVGKDGIHGATFSSEAMDAGSPTAAVQIGDPITQKKLSDAIVKEARDLELYTSITDNGAGGLSCSVAEMARECGGCLVRLDHVPLKYPGLEPWEIWCSESQERMTLAVPPEKWNRLHELLHRRGVEATVIGEFTNSGRCIVECDDQRVMDVDLHFLHQGLPQEPRETEDVRLESPEPEIPPRGDLTETFLSMLGRLNIAGYQFISQQYDHEVQGGSVIKPLQGRGQINGDATVIRPLLDSPRGIVLSHGINPIYGQIDTYHMAACAIDTAIRGAVCAGADPEGLVLLDNFCWCSSDEPRRLGQLKRAARACYDYAVAYGTPFISGKDSMFNDFKGYDENGAAIKIAVLPTLLISAMGVMEDSRRAVSLDAKFSGDLIYILGETHEELGGSEYYALWGDENGLMAIGNTVPRVNADNNLNMYRACSRCLQEGLIASAQSLHRGGLAVALARTTMGGRLGAEISLRDLPGTIVRDDHALFAESQGRILVTICPKNKETFEQKMRGVSCAHIGSVTDDGRITVQGLKGGEVIGTSVESALRSYKSTFGDY